MKKFLNYSHDDIDNTSLTNNSIYTIYKDPQGNMWVGTYDGGVNLFNKSGNKFAHYKHNSSTESLANNFVLDILEDDRENLWVGTDGGGARIQEIRAPWLWPDVQTPPSHCGRVFSAE